MLEKHLDILRCPMTKERLSLVAKQYSKDGHIESGELISSANTYPIVDGIPRFIFSQSLSEKQTVKAFGDQ